MRKRFKVPLILLIIVIIILFVFFAVTSFFKTETQEIIVLDTLDEYGYKLEDRDNDIYVNEFNKLKDNLHSDEINYEEYAKSISKLFIIDLLTIDNKINKYDIGGLEFIFTDYQDNFSLKVSDTIYKYLSTSHKDELPEVTNINVISIEDDVFETEDDEYDGYILYLEWEYEKDLGYETEGVINIISYEDKLFVAEYKSEVVDEESN